MTRLFVFLSILFSFWANAKEQMQINHFTGTWEAAKLKAKTENKFILLDCYIRNCGWCKVMDKEVFTDENVIQEINAHFIFVGHDMELDSDGQRLSMKYHIRAYPTYMFFSPQGKWVYTREGYQPVADFLQTLKNAQDEKTQIIFPGYSDEMDPGFPPLYKMWFDTLAWQIPQPKVDELNGEMLAYLDNSKNLYGEVAWAMMWVIPNLNEKYSTWIYEHADTLRHLYGPAMVMKKILNLVGMQTKQAIDSSAPQLFYDALAKAKKYGRSDSSEICFQISIYYFTAKHELNQLAKLMKQVTDTTKNMASYADLFNNIAWQIYDQCNDTLAQKQACASMEKICALKEDCNNEDTYAHLLFKLKRYDEAEVETKKAIKIGKKQKEDVQSSEALLADIRKMKKK